MTWHSQKLTRRRFVAASALSAVAFAAACSDDDDSGSEQPAATSTSASSAATATAPAAPGETPQALAPTPECSDDDDATIEQTEGPYFTPNSPERASLRETGINGTALVVSGSVVSTTCQPIARALLDFWQCDNDGVYDNEGYTLRGHQFTADDGAYRLETILPGVYPGRTRHIHVKVQAPDQPVLTTQLYFPGESGNASDGIFNEALLMNVQDAADGKSATFTFVLQV
jgi:protocatechuate 3,4-dioxygenase beta subunit